jgi:hypothetical protein
VDAFCSRVKHRHNPKQMTSMRNHHDENDPQRLHGA